MSAWTCGTGGGSFCLAHRLAVPSLTQTQNKHTRTRAGGGMDMFGGGGDGY